MILLKSVLGRRAGRLPWDVSWSYRPAGGVCRSSFQKSNCSEREGAPSSHSRYQAWRVAASGTGVANPFSTAFFQTYIVAVYYNN